MTSPSGAGNSVLFMITSLGRGGAETQLVRVATELARRGWGVRVWTLMPENRFERELRESDIDVSTLGLARGEASPRALARFVRAVRQARPDVVCTFLFHATVVGALAALLAGRPRVVASMRDPNFGSERRLRLVGAACRAGLVDVVVANSERNAQAASRLVPEDRLRVVPNALRAEPPASAEARSLARESLGVGAGEFVWLAVGNLLPEKDYPTLLAAFERVLAERPASMLCIAGRGEPDAAMRALLSRAPLRERVRLLGPRDDVPALLAACDAFVLSSSSEGMPNALMEAAAAAAAIVATDVGGVREIVEHGSSACVVRPRDPAALSRAMLELMAQPAERRAGLGRAAREAVVARYALERVVDRWEAILRGRA
jgi:glycosyltransferase involved in cell wall biosynthesis